MLRVGIHPDGSTTAYPKTTKSDATVRSAPQRDYRSYSAKGSTVHGLRHATACASEFDHFSADPSAAVTSNGRSSIGASISWSQKNCPKDLRSNRCVGIASNPSGNLANRVIVCHIRRISEYLHRNKYHTPVTSWLIVCFLFPLDLSMGKRRSGGCEH